MVKRGRHEGEKIEEEEKKANRNGYLSAGFIVVQVHEIANVALLFLNGPLRCVDELACELDAVTYVVTIKRK